MKTQPPNNPCSEAHRFQNEAGFSMAELVVATALLVVVTGAVFALMRDSLKLSTTTYEMTDAQESLRTAQEYINRDLVNTGDGLNSINRILVPQAFVTNYLAVNPVTDPSTPNIINLPLLQSDNDVPANTTIPGTNPATTVRANPLLTDRISMLEIDP
ncbi:MAG TPA: hypothetical protein VKB46_05515, partial [Pyrinomonadaceae bacterium]|nr:hypothetical protein [Pyrinomonadaceae bacterium]